MANLNSTPKIKVTIDPDSFSGSELNSSFSLLQKKLNKYIEENPLQVDVKVIPEKDFNSTIETVKQQLNTIDRDISITIKNDKLLESIKSVDSALNGLESKSTIDIKINDTQIVNLAQTLGTKFNDVFGKESVVVLSELEQKIAKWEDNLRRVEAATNKAIDKNKKLASSGNELKSTIKASNNDLAETRSNAAAVSKELSSTSSAMNKVKKSLDNLGNEDSFAAMSKTIDNVNKILGRLVKTVQTYASENKDKLKLAFELDVEKTSKTIARQLKFVTNDLKKVEDAQKLKLPATLDVNETAKNIRQVMSTALGPAIQAAVSKDIKGLNITGSIEKMLSSNVSTIEKQANKAVAKTSKATDSSQTTAASVNTETQMEKSAIVLDKAIQGALAKLELLRQGFNTVFNDTIKTDTAVKELENFNLQLITAKNTLEAIQALKLNSAVDTGAEITGEATTAKTGKNKGKTTVDVDVSAIQTEIIEAVNKAIDNLNGAATLLNKIKLKFDASNLKTEVNKAAKDLQVIVSDLSKAAESSTGASSKDINASAKSSTKAQTQHDAVDVTKVAKTRAELENLTQTVDKYKTVLDGAKNSEGNYAANDKVNARIKKTEQNIDILIAKIDALKSKDDIALSVELDDAVLSKLQNDVNKYSNPLGFNQGDVNKKRSELDTLSQSLEKYKAVLDAAKQAEGNYSADTKTNTRVKTTEQSIDALIKKIDELKAKSDIDLSVDLNDKALSKLQNDVNKYSNPLGFDEAQVAETRNNLQKLIADLNKYKGALEQVKKANLNDKGEALNKAAANVNSEIDNIINKIKDFRKKIESTDQKTDFALSVDLDTGGIKEIQKDFNKISSAFKFDDSFISKSEKDLDSLLAKLKTMRGWVDKETENTFGISVNDLIQNIEIANQKLAELKTSLASGNGDTTGARVEIEKISKEASEWIAKMTSARKPIVQDRKELNKVQQAQRSLNDYVEKYESRLKRFPTLWKEIKALQNKLATQQIDSTAAQEQIDEIILKARSMGVEVENLFTKIWNRVGFNFRSMVASMGLMYVQNAFRDIYENVKDLDAAMTELRKVTDETEATYTRFLENASERAQKLGASLVDVVSSTADFSRLGYTLSEATELSDAATIYLNVGDDVEDIDQATKSIISTMQGFGIEASNVMEIVDKFNEVSNRMPTSAGDIGEGLKRSASALAAAGNDLDESIALFTSGQAIVQDADSLGNVLKTTSMRIRGAKTELEEAELDTEGMAESTSKLRSELMALTGGFDIMEDGGETFKSTYDILEGIAGVWDNLTDVSRANILELLAGKRNGNALSGIISNFEMAQKTLDIARNQSESSALKENEVYLTSINGKLSKLTATWEGLSNDVLGSDLVKGAIDFLNGLLSFLDKIVDNIGLLPPMIGAVATAIEPLQTATITSLFGAGGYKNGLKNANSGLQAWLERLKGVSGFQVDSRGFKTILEFNNKIKSPGFDTAAYKEFIDKNKEAIAANKGLAEAFETAYNAQEKTTVSVRKAGSSYVACSSGVKGLATSIKLLGAQILVSLAQFALITAAMWAIGKAISVITDNIPTIGNIKKWAEESASKVEETKSEIESLNSELETTKYRIDELESKSALTFTEQDELDRLKEQNSELERLIANQRVLQEDAIKQSNADNLKLLEASSDNLPSQTRTLLRRQSKVETAQETADSSSNEVLAQEENGDWWDVFEAKYNSFWDKANLWTEQKFLDSAEADITESLKNIQSAIANIDISNLDSRQLEIYNEKLNQYAQTMVDIGNFSKFEGVEFVVGATAMDEFNQKLEEMSDKGERVSGSLADYFGEDVAGALKLVGITTNEVNEHIKSIADFNDYINNDVNTTLRSQLTALANDLDVDIDSSSIKKAIGDDLVKTCEDAGFSIETLISWVNSLRSSLDSTNITGATDDLEKAETQLSALASAYYEFKDGEGKVKASTLSGLAETFADIADTSEFEKFIMVLGNSRSSVVELNQALDDLIDKYFDTQIALGNLTYENESLYTAQLKQMGIANASEVVQTKLAIATLSNANATEDAKEKALKFVASLNSQNTALYNSVAASLTSAQNLQILRIQMELVKSSDFTATMSKNIDAIIELGKAAGTNGEALVEYVQILAEITKIENAIANGDYQSFAGDGAYMRSLQAKAESLKAAAESQFNNLSKNVNTTVDYTPVETSSSSKSSTDKNKEAYDKAKAKLDHQLEMNQISYSNYYKKLVKLGNKYFKKNTENMRSHYETLADVRRSAFSKYKSDLDEQLDSGEISISTYYTNMEKLIKKWYAGRTSNAEDYAEAEKELQEQISSAWNDRISKQKTEIERITLEEVWPEGKTELDYWLAQMEELQKQYRKGMFKDKEAYLEIYYTILENIKNAEKELAQKQLDEVTKKIEAIDDLVDMVSSMLKQRIEDEIDALETLKDTYSDILDQKKKSLEITKETLAYEEEIADLNEDLTKLQAQAELLKFDTSRAGQAKYAELMEQIREKQKDIQDKQADHTYDATVSALEEADEKYQEYIQDKIDALNEKMENQGEWLQYVYKYIETTKPSQLLSELKAYNYKYGDGINQTVDKIWNKYEQYADSVYGNTGYLSAILSELRTLEIKYQEQVDSSSDSSSSSYPNSNTVADIHQASKQSNLKNNSDTQNQTTLQQVKAEYGGNWWYDPVNQNIYQGTKDSESRTVSASAYPLIESMKSINNNTSLSQTERKKQLDAKLKSLQTYYGYGNAHLVAAKNGKYNLYKTAGQVAKWQIFHDGIGAGYTGSDYVPTTKQNELLALLKKGELVFNKDNQESLLTQLQAVNAFREAFSGITPASISQNNYGGSPITLGGISINIYGSADSDTVKNLKKEAENISNMTVDRINKALTQKGFNSGASRGTFSR